MVRLAKARSPHLPYLILGSILLFATPALMAEKPRSTYLKRVQKDVDEIAAKLRVLETRAGEVSEEQKERFNDSLKALWKKERLARVQLEQMKKAKNEKWKKLKAAEDATLIGLKKSYQYMLNNFLK